MTFNAEGRIVFDDVPEMYYNLFNEIGLAINKESYLYDTDTGIVLKFKDKYIKASNKPGEDLYAGKTDVVFDPLKNYTLMTSLFGYYIDKEFVDRPDFYIAQFIDDNPEDKHLQRVVVKTREGDVFSEYYYNTYLGYVENIFNLSGTYVYLKNFDIVI